MAAGVVRSPSWFAVRVLGLLLLPGCFANYEEYDVVSDWGYGSNNGPYTWKENYPTCEHRRQSPISLKRECVTEYTSPKLTWHHYDALPCFMSLANNGRTMMVRGCWGCHKDIPNVNLGDTSYVFDNVHFHWGSTNDTGSEHTINGQRYPLEMHVVHRRYEEGADKRCICAKRRKRPPANDNMDQHDVLIAVILFKVCGSPEGEPYNLKELWKEFPKIKRAGSIVSIEPFPLCTFVPQFQKEFFLYKGSLTTPPCTENVLYAVSDFVIDTEDFQIAPFRTLLTPNGCNIEDNFRPLQKRNKRTVKYITSECDNNK